MTSEQDSEVGVNCHAAKGWRGTIKRPPTARLNSSQRSSDGHARSPGLTRAVPAKLPEWVEPTDAQPLDSKGIVIPFRNCLLSICPTLLTPLRRRIQRE